MKIVAYRRVSTTKQGQSGLGLEAQEQAIAQYAASRDGRVTATFTEVESGKNNARPELEKALHLAKVTGATLVIAKLDRLSRNAAFLLTLRDSGVKFVAADMPDANDLTVGIMALVAQQEREAISRRTTEALRVREGTRHEAGQSQRRGGSAARPAGQQGEPRGDPVQCRPSRAEPAARSRRAADGRHHQPRSNRRSVERAWHAHAARRALAQVIGAQLG